MNQHTNKFRIQELKRWQVLSGILLIAFVVFVILANLLGWKWTGFISNSLWDWLKFLIIPVALVLVYCLWFTMSDRQRRQWARNRWRIFWISLFAMVLIAFIILAIGTDHWGWAWTGFAGNSLWEWISLLFLPVTLTGVTIWFTEHREQEQARNFLTLIPTSSLPKIPSLPSSSSSAVPPPNKLLPVPQQPGIGLNPQRIPPATPPASQPPGRKLSRFGLSRQATLVYLACSMFLLGSIATEVWNFAVHNDHALVSPVSAHPYTIDCYDPAITNGVMLGYNAQHIRVDPCEKAITPADLSQLQFAWKVSTRGTIGSAATVANGYVYISSSGPHNNGIFYALDARTRKVKWQRSIGSYDFGNAPTVANGIVYMGAYDGNLYAYDARTGDLKWKGRTGSRIGSSPTLANGVIYIGSDDDKLYAFNAAGCGSSKPCPFLWSYPTKGHIRSSPAVYKSIVYVGSDDGNLYAIDTSGKRVWSHHIGDAIHSTPAVYKGIVYVGSDDGNLYAFDAAKGTFRWSMTTGGGIDSSPAVYNGIVYVGSNDHYLYAINAAKGTCIWATSTSEPIESSPTIANGVLFIGSDDYNLYAFRASDGKQLRSLPTGGSVVSSPVVANGVVYVGSNDDYLYAFSLNGNA